jgi:hypothetical protein
VLTTAIVNGQTEIGKAVEAIRPAVAARRRREETWEHSLYDRARFAVTTPAGVQKLTESVSFRSPCGGQ